MPTSLQFLFSDLLVLFLLLLTASLSSPQPLCHQDESLALMQFKDSFIIHNSTFSSCYPKTASWSVEAEHGRSECCSSWDGVECDPHTGHVIGLDLSEGCLYGPINSNSSLFLLSHLRSLNLAHNDFNYSKIPSTIGNLSRLTYLNLSQSFVSREVPFEVSYLSKLSSLDLSYNYDLLIIGSLTRLVQNLTCLEDIILSEVNISSTVPKSLANFSSLRTLELEGCTLYGEFPIRILQLPQLRDLWLGFNEDLTGQLPEFHSCTVLQAFSLYYTSFSGSIPNTLWNLTQLTLLDLSNTLFDDFSCLTKASSNHTFPRLQYLSLSSLNLTKFPDFLRNQNKLVQLDLSGNNIQGIIPKWMCNASKENLQDLYLFNNFLTGFENSRDVLPLPNLRSLDLQNNRLQGLFPISQIPPSIQDLYLSNNFLTGFENSRDVIPLPNLRTLYLQNNSLQGSFPISQIPPSIQDLYLSNNFLTGFENSRDVLPWPNLQRLDLQNNRLQGSFPISQIPPSIQDLYLSNNFLTGFENSREVLPLPNLRMLDLQNNRLQGLFPISQIPPSIQGLYLSNNFLTGFENSRDVLPLPNLQRLDLQNNRLQGSFPISQIPPSIQDLYLSNNFLTGFENSRDVLPLPNLRTLDLRNNSLQGSLPIPPPYVQSYRVNKNAFTGEISPLFCNLNSLYVLDLSYNNLSGKLHPCFCNLSQSLIALELRSNNIGGTIPDAWAKGCLLRILDLSHNQLQGRLPRSLANCKELEYLDVGYNKIQDTFPLWLGNLPELKIFILRSNGFYGATRNIQINCTLSNLHIIDLSHNNFSGALPAECFQRWNAMKLFGTKKLQYLDYYSGIRYSITLTTKGIELEYKRIQDELMVIDLSCNRFEGEIPKVVGNLKGLHILNFSNNALFGRIPSSLANLTELESLDLSQNKLFGEIPPQFVQLTFLAIFQVSNNCLTGLIPHGNQFEMFPNSSFDGNPGLCGRPLSKACGILPKPPNEGNQGLVSPFEFGWKVVVIGYGCGFVIGIVIGQWVIARKQDWIVNTFRIKK